MSQQLSTLTAVIESSNPQVSSSQTIDINSKLDHSTKLIVRVGICIYEMGHFDIPSSTVCVGLHITLVYDEELFKLLFPERDRLSWLLPKALEFNDGRHLSFHLIDPENIMDKDFNIKRQENKSYKNPRNYRVELFFARCCMKLLMFDSQDPFQTIFLIFGFAMDGTLGSNRTVFKYMERDCSYPGCRKQIGDFTLGDKKVRDYLIETKNGEFPRLYFIFEYIKSPLEDVSKYYLLPLLINALVIGYYNDVDSLFDSAGAYFLAIIALLFTLPETGAFTRNEKSIIFNSMYMLVILVVLKVSPNLSAQIVLWVVLFLLAVSLISFDYFRSKAVNERIKNVLFDGELSKLDAV